MKKSSILTVVSAAAVALAALPVVADVHTELTGASQRRKAVTSSAVTANRSVRKQAQTVNVMTPVPSMRATQRIDEPVFDPGLPVLYGCVVSSYGDWFVQDDTEQIGYYAFQPESSIKIQPIAIHPNLYINGGGAYSNEKIHYHLWEMYADDGSETGITFHNYYCVVNTNTWSFENLVDYNENQTNIAYDITYDPVTDNLYAVQWGPYDDGSCEFAKIDKTSGESTVIAKIPNMSVIASDNFGQLYTVGNDGNTYALDKTDGSLIKLGASGVIPKYIQSATVDPESNVIYWAATSDDKGGQLYTIDTATGKAVLVADMPDDEEITGLFVEAPRKGLGAPAALESVALSYSGGKSVLTAVIPAKAFDGSQLTGEVSVDLYIDSRFKETKSARSGETVRFEQSVADGTHTIVAVPRNTVGAGPKTFRSQFCGNDVPAAVTGLVFTLNGQNASLTWQAPESGLNGGTIDKSQTRYTVTRFPQGEVVAQDIAVTSFSETLPAGTATYYYTVEASNQLGKGGVAVSNSNYTGTAFTVPYFQPFDTEASLEGFTIINSEVDRGWYWWNNTAQKFQAMASRYSRNNASDNWLILPSVDFKASSEYKLQFTARVFDTESPEKFEVTMGRGATVADQTVTLMSVKTIKNEDAVLYEIPFTVAADGTWNIAFHCVSPVMAYYLIIDDVQITETASAEGPAAVTDLTATAAGGGELKATLNCTLPSKTFSGAALSAISRVEIYRGTDARPTATVTEGLQPGGHFSWTDDAAVQGENVYRVAAFCGDAKGVEASVSVFVGYDTPMPVTDAKAVAIDADNVRISWTAPTKGVSGGDLNQAELTYKVYANTGEVIANGIKDTQFTDTRFAGVENQYFVYYQIHAIYGGFESEYTLTDFIVMGPDNQVPFAESFAEKALDHTPWTLSTLAGNVTGCWGLADNVSHPSVTPQDADGGFAYFKANELPAGCKARMTSPKVDLYHSDHPEIRFWLYVPGSQSRETLEVQITHNDNIFTTLQTIDLTAETGWKEFVIPVPRVHCTEGSMICFTATSGGYGQNICIDNIRISEGEPADFDTDLEAVSITVPQTWMPGEEGQIIVSVYNNGRNVVEDYTVTLYCDGQPVMSTDGKTMQPGDVMDYIFRATPDESDLFVTYTYKGGVAAAGDENPDNDFTGEKSVTIGQSGVSGVVADNVKVFASHRGITVSGAEGRTVTITALDGTAVARFTAGRNTVTAVAKGVYVVRVDNRSWKLLVP